MSDGSALMPTGPPPKRLHLSHLRFTSLDASMEEAIIEKAAHSYGNHLKEGVNMKVAIVASEAFKKAVAFERVLLRYGASVVVFNFLENACTWLGIAAEEIERLLRQLQGQARGRTSQ